MIIGQTYSSDALQTMKYDKLCEVHSDTCGAHQSKPKLHIQIKRWGYYWPTIVDNPFCTLDLKVTLFI